MFQQKKIQNKKETKEVPTANFKDFYGNNVFKLREVNPQEIKTESK